MFVGPVSIAPAAMWNGTIAANTPAQSSVSRRLTALKRGEDQCSFGTFSRAYCSVKGTAASDAMAISASNAAAIARA